MIEPRISENSFIQIALRYYDNPQCVSIKEFEEDLRRFSYLRKLFLRYQDDGILRERLIINHIIILHNIFGVITPELLFFKIEDRFWNTLATFMVYLNLMPDEIPEFKIRLSDLKLDPHILETLRKI